MSVSSDIDKVGIQVDLNQLKHDVFVEGIRNFRGTSRRALDIVKASTPVHSGNLKKSIKVLSHRIYTKKDNGVIAVEFTIGSNLDYAEYPSRLVYPSQGRYVRAIQKRIKLGVHPGSEMSWDLNNITQKIHLEMIKFLDENYDNIDFNKYVKIKND